MRKFKGKEDKGLIPQGRDPWLAVEDRYAQEEAFSPGNCKGSGVKNRGALWAAATAATDKTGITKPYFQNLALGTVPIIHNFAPAMTRHHFTKAADISPDKAITYRLMGLNAIRLGELNDAYDLFDKARTLEPKDPRAPYYIARLLEMNGLNEEALYAANEAKLKCGVEEKDFKIKMQRYILNLKQQTGITQPAPLDIEAS
jgi:tetratricopeptide (TPR) repeat protein